MSEPTRSRPVESHTEYVRSRRRERGAREPLGGDRHARDGDGTESPRPEGA